MKKRWLLVWVLAFAGCSDDAGSVTDEDVAVLDGGDDAAEAVDGGVGLPDVSADVVDDTDPADAGDDAAADVAADAAADVAADTSPDIAADTSPDTAADTSPDTAADTSPDTAPDTSPDAADTDVGPELDVAPDTPPEPVTSPYEPGPHGAAQFDERASIPLGDGSREMDVRLFVPTDLEGAPYPVIVFSHGFQLNGEGYDSYGNRLASHGFVGVFPSYGDGILSPLTHVELAELVSGWVDWAEAESMRGGSRLALVADPERVGAAGHSRGGKQSILAAVEDNRIAAVFGVDPVDSGPPVGDDPVLYPSVTPERMGELVVPAAFLGSGRGPDGGLGGLFPACAPAADGYAAYYAEAGSPSFSYLVEDSGHLDYTDDCQLICLTCPSAGDAGANRSFAVATLVAFFEVFVAGDDRYRPWVDGDAVTSGSPRVIWESR